MKLKYLVICQNKFYSELMIELHKEAMETMGFFADYIPLIDENDETFNEVARMVKASEYDAVANACDKDDETSLKFDELVHKLFDKEMIVANVEFDLDAPNGIMIGLINL